MERAVHARSVYLHPDCLPTVDPYGTLGRLQVVSRGTNGERCTSETQGSGLLSFALSELTALREYTPL